MLKNKAYSRYYFGIVVEIIVLAIFLLLSIGMVGAETGTPDTLQETQLQDAFKMPGRLEANMTHFELKDSRYLNITLDSSEPIDLKIESPPEMVTMRLESLSSATTTKIIMRGFAPQTSYQKYQDDYHNLVTFTTDDSGSYAYTQDLSKPHFIFIQPEPDKVSKTSAIVAIAADSLPGTIFIRDNATGGDCTLIGTWDNSTKTCTLTTNLAETIQIDDDGITLNGNGHIITGNGTGNGVYLPGRSGVTIKSLTVKNFTDGIYYNNYPPDSGFENTLIDNNANSNYRNGIYFYFGGRNNLTNNTANLNLDVGIVLDRTGYDTLLYNNASYNNRSGIFLYQTHNNMLIGNNASNNRYGIMSYQSSENTLKNNIANTNCYGFYFRSGYRNTFINNIANSNYCDGIFLFYYISENNLTNNTANFNRNNGIGLGYVDSNNTLLGNNVSNNHNSGIYMAYSGDNNTVTGNTASNNSYGIHLHLSSKNIIYNNIFNNTNNSWIDDDRINTWNITKKIGSNIVGGPYLGGNFWAYPNGTGFSQICQDNNTDGLCDIRYTLDENNIDYLPLAVKAATRNLIINPGFESGTPPWIFYTDGTGKFTAASPGYEGSKSANIVVYTGGTNIQLYQKGISLEPKTRYRLSFAAYSTRGHDLKVKLIKHVSPYTDYGLDQTFNLGTNWQEFSTEFTTTGFSGIVNDGRLMFYLVPFATAGDTYYIDKVLLEKVTETGTLSVTTTPVSGDIYVDSVKKGTGPWSGLVSVGSHTVSFGPVSGYSNPSLQTVEVLKDQTIPVTGTYEASGNLVINPGFESGTTPWIFYTNGNGKFTASPPGYEGNNSANVVLYTGGTNIQLYQRGISLEPKTRYRLSFAAYSITGHDLKVKLIKHVSPYTGYGLDQTFNLSASWQEFSTEFTTAGFTGSINNGRLMFYLVPFAKAGDKYYIDNVRLETI